MATLLRVIAPERRLRLGVVETLDLAPLVSAWLERGYDHRDLAGALLGGLPARIHSASALLRNRLTRKLPPPPESEVLGALRTSRPTVACWDECEACGRLVPDKGACHCTRPTGESRPDDDRARRARTTARGRALVRAALRTADQVEPAVSGV
ncbi:hypothetical protein [Streptomyces sp. NPDC052042]|uniref:hypothetical protein n=1 Tax=Streptomyces sp. NPDC052042 TaxID=3365683 RepID=UPI0037CEDEDF